MIRFLKLQSVFLWISISVAFGGGLYFAIPFEPNTIFLYCTFLLCILFLIIFHNKKAIVLLITFLLGFSYTGIYTRNLNTPQLQNQHTETKIEGIIKNIDYTDTKYRLFIATENIGTIRVSISNNNELPNIGDNISADVVLFKPTPAYVSGTFDFARWAYFNNLTATGFIKNFSITNYSNELAVNKTRNAIHNQAKSFLVDGLVLGYKNELSKSERSIWATNGVAHIWSISGFHMTLVGGWLFILFYFIFRSIPYITKRTHAKNPALVCAWCGLLIYLCLSGLSVATLRAFLMTTLIFAAFILGRNLVSLRNVCLTFLVLFLFNPHYIMQAGFQLSFSAVFGLVWFWSEYKPHMPSNKILKYLYAAVLTTLIATVFTAPFVAIHFYNFPLYSLLGNLILLPIFSILIMPFVLIGAFSIFIGIKFPLDIAHYFYNIAYKIAQYIANLPYANIQMPFISNIALFCLIMGLSCLVLIKTSDISSKYIYRKFNYLSCCFFILLGSAIIILQEKPVFYLTPDHTLFGVVKNNKLFFNKIKDSGNYFAFDIWKQINGELTNSKNEKIKAEHGVHTLKPAKWTLVYIQRYTPLAKNIVQLCNDKNVKYIASYYDIDAQKCNKKILRGGLVIYKSGHVSHNPVNRWWNIRH